MSIFSGFFGLLTTHKCWYVDWLHRLVPRCERVWKRSRCIPDLTPRDPGIASGPITTLTRMKINGYNISMLLQVNLEYTNVLILKRNCYTNWINYFFWVLGASVVAVVVLVNDLFCVLLQNIILVLEKSLKAPKSDCEASSSALFLQKRFTLNLIYKGIWLHHCVQCESYFHPWRTIFGWEPQPWKLRLISHS